MTIHTTSYLAKACQFFCVMCLLVGCAMPYSERAAQVNMYQRIVSTDAFDIFTYVRQAEDDVPWVIYIEGDGYAWRSRIQPSLDPTPRNPVALKLALQDPSPNLLYLARPCQYIKKKSDCSVRYWTSHRFAPQVIISLNEVMDKVAGKSSPKRLVGYSGGGAVAALIAASRDDVESLRTVAGNLDSEAFTKYHKVTPLIGSLNPLHVASLISHIPQIHYVGGKDKIVPPFIAQRFVGVQEDSKAQIVTVKDASHSEGWSGIFFK